MCGGMFEAISRVRRQSIPVRPRSSPYWRTGRARQLGWTLIELLLSLTIMGTLMMLVTPKVQETVDKARVAKAIGDIQALQTDIIGYEASYGAPPETLAEIGRAGFLDPWKNPYRYQSFVTITEEDGKRKVVSNPAAKPRKDKFLKPLNSSFDLYSMGSDGETKDDLQANESWDDIVRANDGAYVGLASKY